MQLLYQQKIKTIFPKYNYCGIEQIFLKIVIYYFLLIFNNYDLLNITEIIYQIVIYLYLYNNTF